MSSPLAFVSRLRALASASFTSSEFEIAFVVHENRVHWSARLPSRPHEPHSAVSDLIQGLFQRRHDQSFFILRKRLFATGRASEFDSAMVKVAAKRLSDHCLTEPASLKFLTEALRQIPQRSSLEFVREVPAAVLEAAPPTLSDLGAKASPVNDGEWLKLCARLADSVQRGQVLHRYHRPLAAVIVDESGRLLTAATHEGALDKTQHAELRAVQAWYGAHATALPRGARAYVSLKPCRMCAAALARVSANPDELRVIYLNDDPGPHAQRTALEGRIAQKPASVLTVLEGDVEAFAKPFRSPRRS